MDDSIVIAGLARTPIGAMQGVFKDVSATRLGSIAIEAALSDAAVLPDEVDEVSLGCVLASGLGQMPVRQAAIAANIPPSVSTSLVSQACASGLKSVLNSCLSLQTGYRTIAVAGGMECMSRAPYMLDRARNGYRLGNAEIYDQIFLDGLQEAFSGHLMGYFAELAAEKYGITREMQDAHARDSVLRARRAIEEGWFNREITPVSVREHNNVFTVCTDEHPHRIDLEKISQLRPAYKKDGSVTASNTSAFADGAAAFVLMRQSEAEKRGLTPVARLAGFSEHGQAIEDYTLASIVSIEKLLKQKNWQLSDIDLFEINEAFAVAPLNAIKQLQLDASQVNIHGGACALGNPLGASGARMLASLVCALQTHQKKRGIAAMCVGGGEGIAVGVEML